MKSLKLNKKGFTIVELVIVIAVIAVLAAVLIPTFSSLVEQANLSADTQVAKNMNTALATDESINGKAESFGEVISVIKSAGYLIANLNPNTKGHFYVWESSTNQILLVDSSYNVVYNAKEGYAPIGNTWYFAIGDETLANQVKNAGLGVNVERSIANAGDLAAAVNGDGEKNVYLDSSVKKAATKTTTKAATKKVESAKVENVEEKAAEKKAPAAKSTTTKKSTTKKVESK